MNLNCLKCDSFDAFEDCDACYSSYLCLKCGYYYWEDGQSCIEIEPFCLLIVGGSTFMSVETFSELVVGLRDMRTEDGDLKIELRRFTKVKSALKEKITFRNKIFYI